MGPDHLQSQFEPWSLDCWFISITETGLTDQNFHYFSQMHLALHTSLSFKIEKSVYNQLFFFQNGWLIMMLVLSRTCEIGLGQQTEVHN